MLGLVATTGRDPESHELYTALGPATRRVELGARRVHAGIDTGAGGRAIGAEKWDMRHWKIICKPNPFASICR